MTAREAAEKMNLSYASVLSLLRARRLGCRRIGARGGKIEILQSHIDEYLAGCEIRPKVEKVKEEKYEYITLRE